MLARQLLGTIRSSNIAFVSYSTGSASSSSTLTINKPASVASGDLLIAFMAHDAASSSWTGGTGWTEVKDQGAAPGLRVATLTAGGSEPASYSFTCGSSGNLAGMIICVRNAQYDTIGGSVTTRSGTGALAIAQITAAGGMIFAVIGTESDTLSDAAYSTPTGMTSIGKLNGTISVAAFYEAVSAGATGTRSTTLSGTFLGTSGGILIGVKPV